MSKITKEMLVKAELVLNRAKVISPTAITDFIFVLEQYEELANLVDDPQIMPHVGKFDPSVDQLVGIYGRHKISENGYQKINLITMRCEEFLRLKKNVQEQSNKQSNNNSKIRYFVDMFVLVLGCSIFHTIGFNQGANSKERELYDERDSLKSEKAELQKKYSNLNDSIIILNETLNTLQNQKLLKESLNDSIQSVSKKNELYVDSLKRQNHKIDSLQRELGKKTSLYEGFYKMYSQVDDSLNKGLKRRKR